MAFDFDMVCIGSGPAGQRAAVQAAKLGKRVAVIERRRGVGGGSLETGTIPSKTFREAVRFFTSHGGQFDRRAAPRAVARPSAQDLLAQVDRVLSREAEVVENQLRRNDVEVVWGQATFSDPHTLSIRQDDGTRQITAANILIAVGTVPAEPPGIDADGERILTSDHIVELASLPRRLAVVGAGVIGIEYASMFGALGIEVTLIDQRARPLEFLDREVVEELIHQMRNQRVTFRLGETVESMERSDEQGKRVVIHLQSGKRITSDVVLFSVGRQGATDELNLAAAGIEADRRGRLKVDDDFRTSVRHIFAAGDVIGYPSLAATSSRQGRLASCHAFGVDAGQMSDEFPIGIYAIPEVSMFGATEEELTQRKIPYETGVARYREIARGQILGDDSGFLKLLFHREDRSLLGVHIIGTGATELLHIGQAVMRLGGGLNYFCETVFNYPTLAECYKVAALDALNKLNL